MISTHCVSRCGLSTVPQKPSPLSHILHTALHADWVTISVTEWLIDLSGDRERGCAEGEREDVWQLAVNDPCSSSLSIQTLAPPTSFSRIPLIIAESHSAAGENKHCFIYTSRSVNEPPWTTLLGQRTMRCMWERLFSLVRWCARLFDILISVAALRSAISPAGFPDALAFCWHKGIIAVLASLIDGHALFLWMLLLGTFAFRAFVHPWG